MSENYIVLDGKKSELTDEQLKALGIEINKNKNKRWRAEHGESYYYVSHLGGLDWIFDNNDWADNYMYYTHNYFKTEAEAQKYQRVLETERQLMKYADEHNDPIDRNDDCVKYHLYVNCLNKDILIDACERNKTPRTVYFSSEEIAFSAIESVGEDKVFEYLMYEW